MKKITFLFPLAFLALSCQQNTATEEANALTEKGLGIDLNDFDTTVAPCDNFFEYVAGGWMKNNPVPETEARWGNFNILIEENNKKVRGILDSISELGGLKKGSYQQLVSDFYISAMDSVAVEQAGTKPLKPVFDKISAVKTLVDYNNLIVYFELHGIRYPFSGGVGVDDKNSNVHLFRLGQSGLGLPDRDYYIKTDSASARIQNLYKEHIAKMLTLAGTEGAKATQSAIDIYAFEKKLANAQMTRVERRIPEKVYNKMPRAEVVALAPKLNLENYFTKLNVSFDSANIGQVDYLKALNKILPETSISVLKEYARFHAINATVDYLPHAFVQQDFDFYSKTLRGNKKLKPRWRRTLDVINGGLGEQLGHLFVDKYFPESSKKALEAMVEDLRSAYRERINGLEWMSDSTKGRALEKLAAFNYKIGYPDKWKDYSDLEISPNNYFANGQNLKQYTIQENLDKLGKPVDKSEWHMPAHIVNAYYSGSYNEVVFPAGILQPPYFNPNADDAVNYGAIGGVIGHEFTHGFDDRGRKYNAFGNLSNWWSKMDIKRFEERTGRMVVQYDQYEPLTQVFVNGQLTLGENIADLGGLTLAYYGYKMSHVDGKKEPALIDGFSWQQRIFLGWGNAWKTNQTAEHISNQVLTDSHSPAQYRVNGPMSNMPEFKEAWGCTVDDPMVRPDSVKVMIW